MAAAFAPTRTRSCLWRWRPMPTGSSTPRPTATASPGHPEFAADSQRQLIAGERQRIEARGGHQHEIGVSVLEREQEQPKPVVERADDVRAVLLEPRHIGHRPFAPRRCRQAQRAGNRAGERDAEILMAFVGRERAVDELAGGERGAALPRELDREVGRRLRVAHSERQRLDAAIDQGALVGAVDDDPGGEERPGAGVRALLPLVAERKHLILRSIAVDPDVHLRDAEQVDAALGARTPRAGAAADREVAAAPRLLGLVSGAGVDGAMADAVLGASANRPRQRGDANAADLLLPLAVRAAAMKRY